MFVIKEWPNIIVGIITVCLNGSVIDNLLSIWGGQFKGEGTDGWCGL